ncbi:glycosyltransferase [Pseudomonas sp. 10S4]|uniref:glycosyltransferase n=1 Tax=Pseudomonas sp. 10S4 TaxID=3048583 RepID=UPI002AC99FDC|nr:MULTISPECIES: glycosyltransferase [unclassified Pseudomonas]MEB0224708.1 glycosyltransferase [Pseudomonas sp. 5S1]MEB0294463.1 glycosyltransferase [Pseudomonas sp. 10S4]WPX18459.1 glycosyltransferase [Pseudomonas sp. 10S4]
MPVKHPKVAVLLAAYNGMQWIEEQLASILAQSAVDITVFISVDPSTDGTEAWCAAFCATHERVFLLPDSGRFGGAARNFFRLIRDVDLEGYDLVAFADQDDIWDFDKLLRATQMMSLRKADAYSSNVTAFWPDGKKILLDKSQPQVAWDFLFEAAGPGCTYVLNKELARALKYSVIRDWNQLQQVSLHDWYCYAFARSHRFSWFIDSRSTMLYRQHEHNQVGANTGLSSLFQRYLTIHEGWWFNQVREIAVLVGKSNDPFVKKWLRFRRWDLFALSLKGGQCRRRLRDKFLFFFVCCLTAVIGKKAE